MIAKQLTTFCRGNFALGDLNIFVALEKFIVESAFFFGFESSFFMTFEATLKNLLSLWFSPSCSASTLFSSLLFSETNEHGLKISFTDEVA